MRIIHAAKILGCHYLFLKQMGSDPSFQWFLMDKRLEKGEATGIIASSAVQAIHEGHKQLKTSHFRTIHCGFRYTLPERDPVGSNALFWQMALSYNSPNGRYFDEEAGHLCYVDFASQEALNVWRIIQSQPPSASDSMRSSKP